MSYKKVSTVLLVIAASAILVLLAFKIRIVTNADSSIKSPFASKGCCGNSGGGCAQNKQNQGKGE